MSFDEILQPFQCQICRTRFTRRENLKRHAATHYDRPAAEALQCDDCRVTFSRRDLMQRHMRRKHGIDTSSSISIHDGNLSRHSQREPMAIRQDSSCASISERGRNHLSHSIQEYAELSPSLGLEADFWSARQRTSLPLSSLTGSGQENPVISYDQSWSSVQRADSFTNGQIISRSQDTNSSYRGDRLSSRNSPNLLSRLSGEVRAPLGTRDTLNMSPESQSDLDSRTSPHSCADLHLESSFLSPAQEDRGYRLFLHHAQNLVPFFHRPSFAPAKLPSHLALSVLCLGYQFDASGANAPVSGCILARKCFEQAYKEAIEAEEQSFDLWDKIGLVQAYWILEIVATLFFCGNFSPVGLKIHSRMIALIRVSGLAQTMMGPDSAPADLESMWKAFIDAESHKRTILAVHQLDTVWYQLLSIPRALSHLEIKHDLPCPEKLWTAASAAQWAHWQLFHGRNTNLVPYAEAVRTFVGADKDCRVLPVFDMFGIINIVLFLLSSVRETSGWAAMSGQLSLERFQPLRTSLQALEPAIYPKSSPESSAHATLCEATWRIAMIELQMWSISHTSGLVLGSVEALLRQATSLASTNASPFTSHTATTIQPHVDWYLTYLGSSPSLDHEAPWIVIYTFQVFLIAWQLLTGPAPASMRIVDVDDGDSAGALLWAQKAFRLQYRSELDKTISSCLEMLADHVPWA